MSTKTPSNVRTRQRKLDIGAEDENPIKQLIGEVFKLNKQMNAAKNAHDKARTALYAKMKEAKIIREIADGPEGIKLEACIVTPEGQAVDVKKLAKLVSSDKLLEIVSATQSAVTEHMGTAVLNQVLVSTKGTENVKVGVLK